MGSSRNSITDDGSAPPTSAAPGIDDAQLLGEARRGEEAAFHALVDRYADVLYRLAYSLVGSAADAEDVVQETFAGAFKGLAAFRHQASVKTWLIKILVRQAAKVKQRSAHWRIGPGGAERIDESPASEVDAKLDVVAMLQTLSEEHREVLVLRELQGLSYTEMAEALGVPQGTVESRLHRARAELRERFGQHWA